MKTRREFLAGSAVCGSAVLTNAGATPLPAPAKSAAAPGIQEVGKEKNLLDSQKFRNAVCQGEVADVKRYLEADPALMFSKDEHGQSVFLLACRNNHRPVAELLIARGLPLDIFEASLYGDLERVRALMTADPHLRDIHAPMGGTPIHLAAEAGHSTVTEYLVYIAGTGNSCNVPDKIWEVTPLYTAARYADVKIGEIMAERMLANGAAPNIHQKDDHSVLHAAAEVGNASLVRMLIRKGANVALKNRAGKTPLDIAREKQHAETAMLLLQADATPRDHSSSLRLAIGKSDPPAGEAAVDLPQEWINEFVGIAHRDFAQVKALLTKRPALLHARATWEETAVEASCHVGMTESVQFLLDHGAALSLCTAAMLGKADKVNAFLRADPKLVWERGPHDFPVLWYPIFGGGQTEAAEILLKQGADPNSGAGGVTALHRALAAGQTDIVKLLIVHHANVHVKTRNGETPFQIATRKGDAAQISLLKQAGVKE
ncbi:MAG: Ankyrin [Chthonomonadales bacterium]|nr:Ankyrin [Chthonomonadales bacterium]